MSKKLPTIHPGEILLEKTVTDKRLSDATVALAVVTFLLACFTLGLMIFTGKLWRDTRRLVEGGESTARQQALDMRESLAIAKQTADAAEKTAFVAGASLVIAQRAWMHPSRYVPTMQRDKVGNTTGWKWEIEWENTGRTPAQEVVMAQELMLLRVSDPEPEGYSVNRTQPNTPFSLGPGHSALSKYSIMSIEQAKDVQSGEFKAFLLSAVEYRDIFPESPMRHTAICVRLMANADLSSGHPFTVEAHKNGNTSD